MIVLPPTGWDQVKLVFGNPGYEELSGGNVDIDDAWEAKNLVVVEHVCGTKFNVRLHYKIVENFKTVFGAALVDCPAYTVRMVGGYCPRHQRHNPKLPLSLHSYGVAVDFNWDTNPMGPTLDSDLPPAFIANFKAHGWEWGGDWKGIKDPMHFQFARKV